MKKIIVFTLLILTIFPPVPQVSAQNINCEDRYLTLVNPVRSRDLWVDQTINPLIYQYELIRKNNFSATWLLQYDVFADQDLLKEIRQFDQSQELGLFLEVSQNHAEAARVLYPSLVPWYSPQAVFLSAYTRSERRRLIDKLFENFYIQFGFYPKSVGAWWIDSYSLQFMKDKYDIKAAMIVADQLTTDSYGVWGQWWGVPYYPSKANILTPASNLDNKEDVVIIQWAQRDPDLAHGEGPMFSNYSLQANDYIRKGKDTKYFSSLTDIYLGCKNPIGQITVGLETGIESVGYIKEYGNQLKYLSEVPDLKIVTMSQFVDNFSKVFPMFPKELMIGSDWILRTNQRINDKLGDNIQYIQDIAFKDYFIADREGFLDRNLENLHKEKVSYFPYFYLLILGVGFFSFYKRFFSLWIVGTLFSFLSFGMVLKSNYSLGWQVFYGFPVSHLVYTQILIILVSYSIILILSKVSFVRKNSLILWLIPLSFALDFIIQSLRYSYFGGKYYIGVALDNLRFFGISFSPQFNLEFVNKDFPSVISASLLRFDFAKIWDNFYLSLFVYPLIHVMLAVLLGYIIIRLPARLRWTVIFIFSILTIFQLINIFQADPRLVQ